MDSTRHGLRTRCIDLCVLNLNGKKYQCTLSDISISGVLVNCKEALPSINPGDSCGLYLCNDTNVCPMEYPCQIVRVTPAGIGLRFIDMS